MTNNHESQLSSSKSEIALDMSYKSKETDSYYKESDYYNQKITGKLRDKLKEETSKICKKYRFNHKLLRLLIELEFDPDLYSKLKN